ncbi:hypothetical protein ISX56_30210 [Serratia ureilytica]|nr:hypothetical protein [Serratia ureilytica]
MVNYDAQYLRSPPARPAAQLRPAGYRAGFNAGDWIVRSRQTFTRFNGDDRINHQAAYAQRSFVGIKKVACRPNVTNTAQRALTSALPSP